MLIRFIVENFRSFHQEVVFSMLPGNAKTHANHVLQQDSAVPVLQVGAIYGANASGKSNLIKAMKFAHDLIVKGTGVKERILVEPFKLSTEATTAPSSFEFEFLIDKQAYAYGFVIDSRCVREEWLYRIGRKEPDQLLFKRTLKADDSSFEFNLEALDEKLLDLVAKTTRPNELFLNKAVDSNIDFFKPFFDWFDEQLIFIFPDTKFNATLPVLRQDQDFTHALSQFLQAMDTGIKEVCLRRIDSTRESVGLTNGLLKEIFSALTEEAVGILNTADESYLFSLNNTNQEAEIYALGTQHFTQDDSVIEFKLSEESDGTRRLFDLFPLIYVKEPKIFIIDELERSLHPKLLFHFIHYILKSNIKHQFILSTHETSILDQALLRRDEIWFIEKNKAGHSTLFSLEEFKIRNDLNLRKGYLQGRFGAVPILRQFNHPLGEQDGQETASA